MRSVIVFEAVLLDECYLCEGLVVGCEWSSRKRQGPFQTTKEDMVVSTTELPRSDRGMMCSNERAHRCMALGYSGGSPK